MLTSHLLFTYGDRLDDAWHLQALRELVRVARGQVRVFPLLGHVDGRVHPTLGVLRARLAADGVATELRAPAGYEFQRGGDQVLVLVLEPTLPDDGSGTRARPTGGEG